MPHFDLINTINLAYYFQIYFWSNTFENTKIFRYTISYWTKYSDIQIFLKIQYQYLTEQVLNNAQATVAKKTNANKFTASFFLRFVNITTVLIKSPSSILYVSYLSNHPLFRILKIFSTYLITSIKYLHIGVFIEYSLHEDRVFPRDFRKKTSFQNRPK